MKVKELYEQTALLGFEDSLESTEGFFHAANRAILQVNSLRPAIRSYAINHKPLENEIVEDTFSPVDKRDDITFEAYDVKAYYFECDGNGTAIIEASVNNKWKEIGRVEMNSNRQFKPYKGLIAQAGCLVRIRFTGRFFYSVKNVAMYSYLYSDTDADIPAFQPYAEYDMTKLDDDFLVLAEAPILEGRRKMRLNQEYEMEGDKIILIPSFICGEIKILYKHLPNKLVYRDEPSVDETPIDLDEELCSLLPLLVAAFVMAESEPQLANSYMNTYRDWASRLEALNEDHSSAKITTNGW